MKLYLLELIDNIPGNDYTWKLVIRAENEDQARKIASFEVLDKSSKYWCNPNKSLCKEIKLEGFPEIITTSDKL